jgi:hypothetical protein
MSDMYRPYDKLVPIVILGKRFDVPENNLLLRQMQFVAPDIGFGRYCWNAECRYCEISYRARPDGPEVSGLACAVSGVAGLRVTKAATEIRYNMADALAAAPSATE